MGLCPSVLPLQLVSTESPMTKSVWDGNFYVEEILKMQIHSQKINWNVNSNKTLNTSNMATSRSVINGRSIGLKTIQLINCVMMKQYLKILLGYSFLKEEQSCYNCTKTAVLENRSCVKRKRNTINENCGWFWVLKFWLSSPLLFRPYRQNLRKLRHISKLPGFCSLFTFHKCIEIGIFRLKICG